MNSEEAFAQAAANLYLGGAANVSWEQALADLTLEQAAIRPTQLPHSVAEIVAHVAYWQSYLLDVIDGLNPSSATIASQGWPEPGDWEVLKANFFRQARRLQLLTLDTDFVKSRDRKSRPYAMALTNSAGHAVYHLGQIVTVRQALGAWPPAGRGDTW